MTWPKARSMKYVNGHETDRITLFITSDDPCSARGCGGSSIAMHHFHVDECITMITIGASRCVAND